MYKYARIDPDTIEDEYPLAQLIHIVDKRDDPEYIHAAVVYVYAEYWYKTPLTPQQEAKYGLHYNGVHYIHIQDLPQAQRAVNGNKINGRSITS